MPVHEEHEQIFVHIPKCAGSTIESRYNLRHRHRLFEPRYDSFIIDGVSFAPQHLLIRHIHDIKPESKSYSSFTIVRDPIEKSISEYFWLYSDFYKRRTIKNIRRCRQPILKWNESHFQFWLRTKAAKKNMDHLLPQSDYISGVDLIIGLTRLNDFMPELDKLFRLENPPEVSIQKRNKDFKAQTIAKALSKDTTRLISSLYERDMDVIPQFL